MVAHVAALAAYWAGSSSMRHEARSMRHQPPFYSALSLRDRETYTYGMQTIYRAPASITVGVSQYIGGLKCLLNTISSHADRYRRWGAVNGLDWHTDYGSIKPYWHVRLHF